MSGEVVTTIKEYPWIVTLILFILSGFLPTTWGRRWIAWTVLLGRRHGLAYLKKRRAWLQQLHDSDRAYYGWLVSGVLWVLVLLGFQLALEGYMAGSHRFKPATVQQAAHITLDLTRFVTGFIVYTIAINRVLEDRKLRLYFDPPVAGLDRSIAKLEAKEAVHQPRVAA